MPRPTNKPPAAEWERKKEVILSLAIKHSWREVAEMMEKEHNFVAIPDHYDAQMRAWGVHKNLKAHEWRGAMQRLDDIASRHQRKTRMRILGKIVPDDRLRRSRSRYNHRNLAVLDIVPSHVSFEVLGADGGWYADTSTERGIEPSAIRKHPVASSIGPEPVLEDTHTHSDQNTDVSVLTHTVRFFDNFATEMAPEEIIWDLNLPKIDSMSDGQLEFRQPSASESDPGFNFDMWTPGSFDLAHFYSNALDGLPFKQFQRELKSKGIDLRSLHPNPSAIRTYGTSKFVTPFLRDIASCIASTPTPGDMRLYVNSKFSLLAFQTLLPGKISIEQCKINFDLASSNTMLEANFSQLLIFSMTNGFAGLKDMPLAGLFRFLSRYGNVDAVFGQILQASPRHVAKSLAENLFRVAIEAQESHVVMQLLKTELVQVNKIVCPSRRGRVTAAQRAAKLRDVKTLQVLISAGADVNKTYEPNSNFDGCLERFINELEVGEITPDVMTTIENLLKAGARTDLGMVNRVLRLRHQSEIALRLLLHLLPVHHIDIFPRRMLSICTLYLEQEQAREAMIRVLQACEIHHNGECFRTFEDEVEWAVIESAKRGHLQVVQLLFPYLRRLDRVLTASFSGGARDVVHFIMTKHPTFDFPAVPIERDDYALKYSKKTSTPLAEALLTENEDLIAICEMAGAIEHIQLDGHLESTLTATATTGNSSYFNKLLRYGPTSKDMSNALRYAIQNGHMNISLQLITAGATFPHNTDVLNYALKKRDATVVRAILDCYNLVPGSLLLPYDVEWFHEAIKWNDRSIISDLRCTFPHGHIQTAVYPEDSVAAGNNDFLVFLIDLGLIGTSSLTAYLAESIKNNKTHMIGDLIELGAEPTDPICLFFAATTQPGILDILLDHIPKTKTPRIGLGTEAILETVDRGLAGLESLDVLLLSEVVDFRSFSHFSRYTYNTELPHLLSQIASPLGLAIKNAVYHKGDFPVVRRLLDAGCDPDSVVSVPGSHNNSNMTALLVAVQTKNIDLVRLLLKAGAKMNIQAVRGVTRTPLQLAAELGCLEIVQLLINEGAEINAPPAQRGGGTALQLAAISGNCNIAAELLSHGANPEVPPSILHGRWPIEGAAEHGRLDMIDYLLKVTVFNAERCKRATELAQENGHMGCYDLILEHVHRQQREEEISTMGLAGFI